MQNYQNDQLNKNQELREIVKEVVREELKDDLEKMKKNHHLKEGYQYLNE